jgi:cell division protein FtsI (penicillin-binding protein 3)
MGSTFKPFTVAMALETGDVKSMGQIFPCYDRLALPGGRVITDTHPFGRPCSVAEIMMESSNIGTALIAAKVGGERQRQFLKQMGFLDRAPIQLPEKSRPLSLKAPWGEADTMTIGFGHAMAVTPLHLASGYATLYNGGVYRSPTLVKVDARHPVAPGRRVYSEETSYKMRSLLRLVVTKGTGKKADAPGYRVGGKTGTAEKPLPGGGYSKTDNITSFAGVFPMDEPRYAMVVMLDAPRATAETYGWRTAGWNAAPTFGKVVARIAPMLGLRPDLKRDANMDEVLPYVREEK